MNHHRDTAPWLAASLIYPLENVDVTRLPASWRPGPFTGMPGGRHVPVEDRDRFYANQAPILDLLDDGRRRHQVFDDARPNQTLGASWVPQASEVLVLANAVDQRGSGYAVVHALPVPGEPEIKTFEQLAAIARPARAESRAFIAAAFGDLADDLMRQIEKTPRATSLVLSGWPDAESPSLIRWEGSSALERRLATMMTLPKDGRALLTPFAVPARRPTPSHVTASSPQSVAVVRCRPLRADHLDEMRTLWLDALLLEISQRDQAAGFADRVTKLERESRGHRRPPEGQWRRLDGEFRAWRAGAGWQTATDHAMESALASDLRAVSGTEEIIARVESELEDQAAAEVLVSSNRIGTAVALLAVASTLIPVLLHLAGAGAADWSDPFWLVAAVLALAVLGVAVVVLGSASLVSRQGGPLGSSGRRRSGTDTT